MGRWYQTFAVLAQTDADFEAWTAKARAAPEALTPQGYATSEQRKNHLPEWTHMYNWHRPHGSLNSKSPISRLGQPMDNLLRFHS